MLYVFLTDIINDRKTQINEMLESAHNSLKKETEEYLYNILCKELKYEIKFCYLSLNNYKTILQQVTSNDVIFNLCDGTEDDGVIGITLVKEMERLNLRFTGAKEKFYYTSTFKSLMKECFIKNNVRTAKYWMITTNKNLTEQTKNINLFPLFVKPNNFYNGLGLDEHSIVHNKIQLFTQLVQLRNTGFTEIIVEEYLDGDEYTVLVTDKKVYPPCHRIFGKVNYVMNDYLYDERCIHYNTELIDENTELSKQICEIAKKAYNAVHGNSYGRVDIRMKNNMPYILEVNANPSIGPDASTLKILQLYKKIIDYKDPEIEFYNELIKSL